jgi:hypothetical protein
MASRASGFLIFFKLFLARSVASFMNETGVGVPAFHAVVKPRFEDIFRLLCFYT